MNILIILSYIKKILFKWPYRVFCFVYYSALLKKFHYSSVIDNPLRIDGGEAIHIGKNVLVQYKTWLGTLSLNNSKPLLYIDDGCIIGHFNHIYATKSIIIHKNVLTADKVYISDNLHGYKDIKIPIKDQPVIQKNVVEIGENTWLGENVCILGASIGRHCVIGANSVVTHNIPDYCVAVGIPAKIIKKYNFQNNSWEKI